MAKTFLNADHFEEAKIDELFLVEWCDKNVHVKFVGRTEDNKFEFECVDCDGEMSVIYDTAQQAAENLFKEC